MYPRRYLREKFGENVEQEKEKKEREKDKEKEGGGENGKRRGRKIKDARTVSI